MITTGTGIAVGISVVVGLGLAVGLAVGLGVGVSSTAIAGAARLIANADAAEATKKDLEKIAIYLKIDAHASTA